MKIPILLFAVVALGGILVAQNSKPGKDESAIRKADVEWSQAVEANDLDKTGAFCADDASVYAPTPIVIGKDNIRQAWGPGQQGAFSARLTPSLFAPLR